jgi:hypothetical protein
MKKVKALLALTALVTMVGVASIASAQGDVTVTGNIPSSTLSLGSCSIPLGEIPTDTNTKTQACDSPGSITANTVNGVNITLQGNGTGTSGNELVNGSTSYEIPTLTDTASDDACSVGSDCYSFGSVTLSGLSTVSYADPNTDWSSQTSGEGTNVNTDSELPIPATGSAEPIVLNTDTGNISTATWDLSVTAAATPSTDAGSYTGALLLTIAEN